MNIEDIIEPVTRQPPDNLQVQHIQPRKRSSTNSLREQSKPGKNLIQPDFGNNDVLIKLSGDQMALTTSLSTQLITNCPSKEIEHVAEDQDSDDDNISTLLEEFRFSREAKKMDPPPNYV
ncbi:hypothetical protein ACEPPN_003738 [Leptodophora sp. 'Broadleaf-Isolate-01']